jgi:hypothetical protein
MARRTLAHPKEVAIVRFEGDYELAKIIVDALNRERGFMEYKMVAREGTAEKTPSKTKGETIGKVSDTDDERYQSSVWLNLEKGDHRIALQIEKERTKQKNSQLEIKQIKMEEAKARLEHEYKMRLLDL